VGAAASPAQEVAPKRSVPRYKLAVPAEVTVLRSGIPENVPARTVELGEGGIGVVVASRLLLGESVRVEFLLPHTTVPVRATAVVRYQRELCCGLQFVRLPSEQQSIIRYWTRCEAALSFSADPSSSPHSAVALANTAPEVAPPKFAQGNSNRRPWAHIITLAVFIVLVGAVLQYWYWEHEWSELEPPASHSVKPQLTVPAEVMQRRLQHQVAAEYPLDVRRPVVQGTVVLDAVVSADGSITEVRYRSGPVALANAAMDAVRWWRYEPYRINGQAAAVATTVAVDFHSAIPAKK